MTGYFRFAAIAMLSTTLLGSCGAPAPSAAPPAEPSADQGVPTVPAAVSNERDGVVVTLSASTARAAAGHPLRLHVDVLNASLGPVAWQSGGCGLLNGFAVDGPPIDQPPAGKEWPDAAGLAKWSATTGGVAIDWIHTPTVPEGAVFACTADLSYDDIDPGQTISADAIWSARTSDGVPAPSGDYRVTYTFPFIARGSADQLGVAQPAPRPIQVALPLVLDGEPFDGIPGTKAIDAAFSDPRVAAWVDGHLPKSRLAGADIRYVDGTWRFTIKLIDDRQTVVLVDAETGQVVDVHLAD
jgi:hypothetical protein